MAGAAWSADLSARDRARCSVAACRQRGLFHAALRHYARGDRSNGLGCTRRNRARHMRLTRVYVGAPIAAGTRLVLEGSAANHVARVLRLRVGDPVTVFNGSGGEFDARIEGIQKDTLGVSVEEHRALDRESPLSLTLVQGISRGERMDWVIQKATELGTSRIVPVFTKRSVVRLDESQEERKLQH